jgi:hypothetical protein
MKNIEQNETINDLQQDLIVLMDIIIQQTVDNLDLYFEQEDTKKFETLVDTAIKYKD